MTCPFPKDGPCYYRKTATECGRQPGVECLKPYRDGLKEKQVKRYKVYINDYGAWYGPQEVSDEMGVPWSNNLKFDPDYGLYSDQRCAFYFDDLEDAKDVKRQLEAWGHSSSIFLEL